MEKTQRMYFVEKNGRPYILLSLIDGMRAGPVPFTPLACPLTPLAWAPLALPTFFDGSLRRKGV